MPCSRIDDEISYTQQTKHVSSLFGSIQVDWDGQEGCLEKVGSTYRMERRRRKQRWAWVGDHIVNPNGEQAAPFLPYFRVNNSLAFNVYPVAGGHTPSVYE